MNRLLVCLLLFGSPGWCAESESVAEGPWDWDRLSCKQQGTFPLATWALVRIKVGESTLKEVEERLGPAATVRPGRGASGAPSLCYDLGDEGVAVFESSKMADAPGQVTAISLLDRSFASFTDGCSPVASSGTRSIPSEITPGTKRSVFEGWAGQQHCNRGDNSTEWNAEQLDGEWTTLAGLKAHFSNDKLDWWRVYRVRSR